MIVNNYFVLDAMWNLVKKNSKWEYILATLWNDKWKKIMQTYQAQEGYQMDVRNLILTKSYILEPIAKLYKGSNDEKALKIFRGVRGVLTYKGDFETRKTSEYWENPEITYQRRTGDCEDGALLITTLMRLAGIPSFRVKCITQWVQNPKGGSDVGHCLVHYLSEQTNRWYILDWCYYSNESELSFLNTEAKDMLKYHAIWWTFNDEFVWAQKKADIE